jgi:glycogen(starch) synthase
MHVLRLCSVFEAPAGTSRPPDAKLDPVGGMQSHTGALTRALDGLGVTQDVVTATRAGARRRERLGAAARVHRVGVPVTWGRQCWSVRAAPLALWLGRRADVVHAHLGEDIAVLAIAEAVARLHRVPLVVTVHTSVRHTLVASDARSRRIKRWGGPLEARAAQRAAAVITLTERLRALAIEDGAVPSRVRVIPSGVRCEDFTGPLEDPFGALRRPRVLFVGRLAFQKGVLTLVEAVALMQADAAVVLVGDGPDRRAVERRVAELGLQDRVHFTGFLPHAEIPAVLRHGDVLVLPSAYEELGSVLLEGMRAGLPVVASDTGGIPEVVDDGVTGVLCPTADAPAFAAAIDELLADPARRARLGATGRERVRGFAWDRLAPRVLAVYRDVLSAPASWGDAAPPGQALVMRDEPTGEPVG